MNKILKGLLVAGAIVSVASAGAVAGSVEAEAAVKVSASSNTDKINALIKEKQEVIAQKKVSTDWREQKALGMRLGEIEREISMLKKGGNTGNSNNSGNTGNSNASTNAAKIQELIAKKMDLVAQKKVSRNKNEQKALGKQIDAIEKEIKQLKKNK